MILKEQKVSFLQYLSVLVPTYQVKTRFMPGMHVGIDLGLSHVDFED